MIKLYRDSAEQLAMCLHYIMYRAGVEMSEVQNAAARTNNLSNKEIVAMKRSLRTSSSTLTPIKEQFDELIKAINDEDLPNKDGDLIDLMVQTLQLPHVQNVLSGGRLTALKKAILLPSEFGALAERVRAREMSCSHCGSQFRDGEAVTLRHSGDRTAPGVVYCASCVRPDVITCPGCKKLCAIQKMLAADFLCPECMGGPKKEKGKYLKKAVADFTGRAGGAGLNTLRGAQTQPGTAAMPTVTATPMIPDPVTEAAPGGVQRDPRPQYIVRDPEPWNEEAANIINHTVAATGGVALTYAQMAQTAAAIRNLGQRAARTFETADTAGLFPDIRHRDDLPPPPTVPRPAEADFDEVDFEDLP